MAEETREKAVDTAATEETTAKEVVDSFKAIETQEALDAIIKDRLSRERKKGSEATAELQRELEESKSKFDELNARVKDFDKIAKENEELKASVKKYETDSVKTRISHEMGLPLELASRLQGSTEEEIKADAEILMKSFPVVKKSAPQRSTEALAGNIEDISTVNDKNGLMDMLTQLNDKRK